MLELVNKFGQFNLQDLADSNMTVVLDTWLDILQQQLAIMADLDEDLFSQSQLIPAAEKQQWLPVNVWFGLKVLLGLMEVRKTDETCKLLSVWATWCLCRVFVVSAVGRHLQVCTLQLHLCSRQPETLM